MLCINTLICASTFQLGVSAPRIPMNLANILLLIINLSSLLNLNLPSFFSLSLGLLRNLLFYSMTCGYMKV
ncbi:hypothetical protein K469DRAFT_771251 [Zopfia rhizophila CBS 207.26]|uniref:Uncharacterized protein n=1 Tax=Zopfia rhizophila CBS 207.26 TaxID=1314779 RepID=A0A6A6E758_9PEZI|nr:hypothetical protein K469DRAFT_771251 [Zopfia rhizophila CBS 207.26]